MAGFLRSIPVVGFLEVVLQLVWLGTVDNPDTENDFPLAVPSELNNLRVIIMYLRYLTLFYPPLIQEWKHRTQYLLLRTLRSQLLRINVCKTEKRVCLGGMVYSQHSSCGNNKIIPFCLRRNSCVLAIDADIN